jgi:hypothetical protein
MNYIVFDGVLLVAGFIAVLVFSLGIMACLSPLALFRNKENPPKGVMLIVAGIAAVFQIYFWGLWSAFCVAMTRRFTQKPEVTWDWLYWITGFLACTSLIGWLAHKERQNSQSPEENPSSKGTAFYSLVAIAAFLAFAFAPSFMLPPYGWALKPLGLQDLQDERGRIACRTAIVSFNSAHKMMSDEAGNVVQLTKAEENQMKQLIQLGLSSATQVPDRFLDSVHPELKREFAEHLVLGWRLYLEGLNSNDPARQIAGIQEVQRWQAFKDANVDLLYHRIIE